MSHNGNTQITAIDLEMMAEKKNLICVANRCWHTAARLITAFPKSQRKQMKLVEGTCRGNWHFWIQLDNGEIFDPHYWHFDIDEADEFNSCPDKLWDGESITWEKGEDGFEEREGSRWNDPEMDFCRMKIFRCRGLDFDNMTFTQC